MTGDNRPRVSFIVPAYNAARTLRAAVDSLVAQSIPDWEAVIIDDGSRDATWSLMKTLARSEPRLRIVRQRNRGASAARNVAIGLAQGDRIAFLDADDWIAPDFLARLLGLLAGQGREAIAYCSYVRVTPDGEHTPPDWCPDLQHQPFEFLASRCEPAIHCVLVSRSMVLELGGFDEDLANCEDWDLWLKLARAGAYFVGMPEPLAFYRMRKGSLSTLNAQTDRNSQIVMDRAGRPDPRVPRPDPRYANGIRAPRHFKSDLYDAIDLAARRLAAAEDADLAHLPALAADKESCAVLIEGMEEIAHAVILIMAERAGCEPAEIDDEVILDRLGPIARILSESLPAFGRALRDAVSLASIKSDPLEEPRRSGQWYGVRLDLRRPPGDLALPVGVESVFLKIGPPYRVGQQIELPAKGVLPRDSIADALMMRLPATKLLRRGRLPIRPRFWAGMFGAVPHVARMAVGHGAGMDRLRLVPHEALRAGIGRALGASRSLRLPAVTPLEVVPNGRDKRCATIPVLLFSDVVARRCGHLDPAVSEEQLSAILSYLLRADYQTIPMEMYLQHRAARRALPRRSLGLLFRDPGGQAASVADRLSAARLTGSFLWSAAQLCDPALRTLREGLEERGFNFGLAAPPAAGAQDNFLSEARAARAALNGGTRRPAFAAVCHLGVESGLLHRCGFDMVFGTGLAFASIDRIGHEAPAIACSGAESLGMLVELLRGAD